MFPLSLFLYGSSNLNIIIIYLCNTHEIFLIELNTEMIGNGFTESLPNWLKNAPTTNTKWYLYAKLAVKFGVWEVWDDSPKPPVNSIFMRPASLEK